MDSQRGANWANIGAFFVGLLLLVLGLFTFGYMVWSRWYPDPSKAPAIFEGSVMRGSLPLYFVVVCLFIVSVVQIVLFRALRAKNKATPPVDGQTEVEKALIQS